MESRFFLLTASACQCSIVLPCMASLVAKKKANTLYYYVVESARVDGKPRIVHQTYLGTAERVAALVKDRTAPWQRTPRRTSRSREDGRTWQGVSVCSEVLSLLRERTTA